VAVFAKTVDSGSAAIACNVGKFVSLLSALVPTESHEINKDEAAGAIERSSVDAGRSLLPQPKNAVTPPVIKIMASQNRIQVRIAARESSNWQV
jgi:hypothetical protein